MHLCIVCTFRNRKKKKPTKLYQEIWLKDTSNKKPKHIPIKTLDRRERNSELGAGNVVQCAKP